MAREDLIRRVRTLRAMTTANGCTEAEALAAARKAAAIMRDAGLSDKDLEIAEAGSRVRGRGRSVGSKLWAVIAHATNTKAIVITSPDGTKAVFIGREPGPMIADYLRDICDRAIEREVRAFKTTPWYRRRRTLATRRLAVADFTAGMVARLTSRLLEAFADSVDEGARAMADQALKERYAGSVNIKAPAAPGRYSDAADAGWLRGGSVPLNRCVASADPLALPFYAGGA